MSNEIRIAAKNNTLPIKRSSQINKFQQSPQAFLSKDKIIQVAAKTNFVMISFIGDIAGEILEAFVQNIENKKNLNDQDRYALFCRELADFICFPVQWIPIFIAQKPISHWVQSFVKEHPQRFEAKKVIEGIISLMTVGMLINHTIKPAIEANVAAFFMARRKDMPNWLLDIFDFQKEEIHPSVNTNQIVPNFH